MKCPLRAYFSNRKLWTGLLIIAFPVFAGPALFEETVSENTLPSDATSVSASESSRAPALLIPSGTKKSGRIVFENSESTHLNSLPAPPLPIVSSLEEGEKKDYSVIAVLELRYSVALSSKADSNFAVLSEADLFESILLSRRFYAPAVPIFDRRHSIDKEEVITALESSGSPIESSSTHQASGEKLTLLPVDEITPPLKALEVSDKTFDEPGYPLYEDVRLELRFSENSTAVSYNNSSRTRFSRTSFSRTDSSRTSSSRNISSPAKSSQKGPNKEARSALLQWWRSLAEQVTKHKKHKGEALFDAPTPVFIGGVGDMMLERGIQSILLDREGEDGLSYIFGDTLEVLRSQDFLLGNLEGAVTLRRKKMPKSYNFRFRPEVLPRLKAAGFDYLSITNNHCYDYGREGFIDTLASLEKYSISTSGAGLTPEEAYGAALLSKSTEVAVFSFGAYPQEKNGFNGREQASVTPDRPGIAFSGPEAFRSIEEFSSPGRPDVVMIHGGVEWRSRPVEEQKRIYRKCIDSGADLVLGSHPHVLQGMEVYRGKLIAYSLGNFLFPGMYVMPNAEESIILSTGFLGDTPLYVRPYPVRIDNRRLHKDKTGETLSRFLELSKELNAK